MRQRRNLPTQFRLDSDGDAQPNELARFVDSQLIEGAGITLVDGVIQEPVEIGTVDLKSSYTTLNDISSTSGELILNFNSGSFFRFEHDESITLTFVNVPAGRAVLFTLIRINQPGGPHLINWAGSAPDFFFSGGEAPILTDASDAIDVLYLTTYSAGTEFLVNVVGNFG